MFVFWFALKTLYKRAALFNIYFSENLVTLTYRFDKVKERAKLKYSVSRLDCILFPELEKLVPTLHMASVYALLFEFPGAKHVASAHLTRLANLLSDASKGRYGKDTAILSEKLQELLSAQICRPNHLV